MFKRMDDIEIVFAKGDSTASAGPSPPGTADLPNLAAMLRDNMLIIEDRLFDIEEQEIEPTVAPQD